MYRMNGIQMTRTRINAGRALVAVGLLLAALGCAQGRPGRVDLEVGIFMWLPDASTAIERLERDFERVHPGIDLDLRLVDPYSDDAESGGLALMTQLDLIEIDAVRLDELMAGGFGGLDPLPDGVVRAADDYVEPAATVARSDRRRYFAPHWICGYSLVLWADGGRRPTSFGDLLDRLDPADGRPLLADMGGKGALGELYADAVVDLMGIDAARAHLVALARRPQAPLVAEAAAAVAALANELAIDHRANRSHYHDHADVYPRSFATQRGAAVIGYSEALYHANRELAVAPGGEPIGEGDVVVMAMPFGEGSRGTPAWVDGFVVPAGTPAAKREAVAAFLRFIVTDDGYRPFARPDPYRPPSYLLPAAKSAYAGEIGRMQPGLSDLAGAIVPSLLMDSPALWQGMETAGKRLQERLAKEHPEAATTPS